MQRHVRFSDLGLVQRPTGRDSPLVLGEEGDFVLTNPALPGNEAAAWAAPHEN